MRRAQLVGIIIIAKRTRLRANGVGMVGQKLLQPGGAGFRAGENQERHLRFLEDPARTILLLPDHKGWRRISSWPVTPDSIGNDSLPTVCLEADHARAYERLTILTGHFPRSEPARHRTFLEWRGAGTQSGPRPPWLLHGQSSARIFRHTSTRLTVLCFHFYSSSLPVIYC